MACHIITYDLNKVGQNYYDLTQAIKSYKVWCHLQGSVWLIKTHVSTSKIRDHLWSKMDSNDKLFVAELTGNWGSYGLSQEQVDWLKQSAFA